MYDESFEVDLHGKNKYQARIMIDNVLRKARPGLRKIRVVHGYRLGTELRDMVREEYSAHPKVKRIEKTLNEGETLLILKEK